MMQNVNDFFFLEHRRIFKIKMFESLLSIVSKLNFYEIFIEILVLQTEGAHINHVSI